MSTVASKKPSPDAAAFLSKWIENDGSPFDNDADERMGETDCPDGCQVEPDGHCYHGYLSAALTLGVI